jgi:hypothetical protein
LENARALSTKPSISSHRKNAPRSRRSRAKLLAARVVDGYSALDVCRSCDESQCPDYPVDTVLARTAT